MRRLLLGAVTALLVARPLTLGEDPGLLAQADTSSLLLTLLWMAALVAWAGWRFWFHRPEVYVGLTELFLFGLVGVLFVSAEVAAQYHHPARLIAWGWCGLLVTLLVIRQLGVSREERHGLFCVLLASSVSLSAHGIYQYTVDFPAQRALADNEPKLRKELTRQGLNVDIEGFKRRLRMDHVFATYSHPNTYAGYMALTLPGLAVAVWLARRVTIWRTFLVGCCAAVGLMALLLTHSRGALLGVGAASLLGAVVFGWRWFWRNRLPVMAVVLLAIGVLYAAYQSGLANAGMGKGTETMAVRLDYWSAAWKMIQAHGVLGVGPGNFGRYYPRYMAESAVEKIKEPHNLVLEILAEAGPFALGFLVLALGWLLFQCFRGGLIASRDCGPTEGETKVKRWEFLVGGLAGTLLGLAFRFGDNPGADVVLEGVQATLRTVVWFLAFALFDYLPWTDRIRSRAIAVGITGLLVNLCVSDGISSPQLAVILWACAALALNALPVKPTWSASNLAALALPLSGAVAVLLTYFILAFNPVFKASNLQQEAEQAMPKAVGAIWGTKVIIPLSLAAEKADPADSRRWLDLAKATAEQYRRQPLVIAHWQALNGIKEAHELDPANLSCYLTPYNYLCYHADRARPEVAKEEYRKAADILEQAVPYDPTDAPLHYLVARAYHFAEDPKWQEHAREALRLDAIQQKQPLQPARILEAVQRTALERWLQGDKH